MHISHSTIEMYISIRDIIHHSQFPWNRGSMDRTIIAVHRMLDALAAATYDVGILSDRGMFPGHASLTKEAVVAHSNFLYTHHTRRAHIHIPPSGIYNLNVLDD